MNHNPEISRLLNTIGQYYYQVVQVEILTIHL